MLVPGPDEWFGGRKVVWIELTNHIADLFEHPNQLAQSELQGVADASSSRAFLFLEVLALLEFRLALLEPLEVF